VLSGPLEAVHEAEAAARDAGTRPMVLPVSGAFHSPLMEPAAAALREALERVEVREPSIPVWSNGSAAPFVDVRRELAENLLRPVRWRETVLAMHEAGFSDFRELGPGRVLTGMVKRTVGR
jgi:malonyl CoA-acyl carrier protein transacylase